MALDVRQLAAEPEEQKSREEEERGTVEELEQKWSMADNAVKDTFRLWKENISFIEGMQWIRVRESAMLNVQGISRNRIRIADNRLLDHARRLHARLDQVSYSPTVVADSLDDGDRQAARAGGGLLRWFDKKFGVKRERRHLNWWVVVCGQGYVETYFDPQAGNLVSVPELDTEGNPVMEDAVDDVGQPITEPEYDDLGNEIGVRAQRRPVTRLEPEGNVGFMVRSPFAIRRDPRFQDWRKLRWIFIEEVAAKEEVLDRFKDMVPELDKRLPSAQYQTTPWLPELVAETTDVMGLPKQRPLVKDVVTLRRYYERPSSRFPRGRFVIYAGNVIFYSGDMPTPNLDFPIVPFSYMGRPWYLEGKGAVDAAKALQRLYNRILSRFAEHLVRLPAGWLLVPVTSGIPKRSFTSETGSIIRYVPGGGEPKFVFPPFGGLAWYDRFLSRLEVSMEERMALPPAVRGQLPKGARAARTVELLQEAADAIQAPVLNDLASSWEQFYMMALMFMHKHFTIDRMVRLLGEDKYSEVMEFKGETIYRDWTDRLSVKVEAGESLPSSKMMRLEFILTLAARHQFFGQPGTPDYVRKLAEALDIDAGFMKQDSDIDVSIAEDENIRIMKGDEVPVREIDDHLTHIRVHLMHLKRLVVARKDEEAERLMPHLNQHTDIVTRMAQDASQKAAADVQAQRQEQAVIGAESAKRQTPPVPRIGGTGPTARVMEEPAQQVMGGQGGGAT